MTAVIMPRDDVSGRGRHLRDGGMRDRLARVSPALFAQCAVIVLVGALMWPASLGGAFGIVAIAGQSMEPTYELGDVVITWRSPVAIGDVILYRVPEGSAGAGNPVIHRVIGGDPNGWETKGDNVARPDQWRPSSSDVLGVTRFETPLDARVVGLLRSWWVVAITGGVAVALLLWPDPDEEGRSVRGRHRA